MYKATYDKLSSHFEEFYWISEERVKSTLT